MIRNTSALRTRTLWAWRLAVAASTALCAVPAGALPTGGTVTGGNVTVTQPSSGQMVIDQTTDRGALDWRSFSIGTGESVRFNQPSASSITFNRVTGSDPSRILGSLSATGQVWLINPNGVLFGASARVDTAGLVVSTAGMRPGDFMAGSLDFNVPGKAGATIVNEGLISIRDGGLAAFVAPGLRNAGIIEAQLGKVALGSGETFTLDLYGDGLVKLAVADGIADSLVGVDGKPLAARVENSGTIRADGGSVLLTTTAASQVVDNLINVSGTVQARAATVEGGKIVLQGAGGTVRVSGTLDASGTGTTAADSQTGGTVQVTGERVALSETAVVDVSGNAGGGTALIGGDLKGQGSTPTAKRTVVASGATIKADAVKRGKGGKVVVWSDEDTRFGGTISARGGAAGGDGGFAEVSGGVLQFRGKVDLAAPLGAAGTLLLDPTDIRITADIADSGNAPGGQVLFADVDADPVVGETRIFNGDLSGLNVILQANRDVIIGAPLTAAAGASPTSLTISAGRDILVNADVETNALSLTAGGAISGAGVLSVGGLSAFKAASLDLTAVQALAGAIGIDTTGDARLTNGVASQLDAVNVGGDFTLAQTAGGVSQVGGPMTVGGLTSIASGPGGSITLDKANQLTGAISLTSSGDTRLVNQGATVLGTVDIGGAFDLDALGAVSQTGKLAVQGTTRLASGGNAITLNDAGNLFGGTVTLADAGAVELTSGQALTIEGKAAALSLGVTGGATLGTLDVTGDLAATTTGAITQTGALTVGGATTLATGGAAVTLTEAGNSLTGAVTLNGTGATSIFDTAALTIGGKAASLAADTDGLLTFSGLTLTGALQAQGDGGIVQTAALDIGGTSELGSSGAAITLTDAANRFAGAVTLVDAGAVSIFDTAALTIGGKAASLAADTDGLLTFSGLTLTGALQAQGAGGIVQTGALDVGGTSELGSGAAITLTDAANRFAGAVTLVDAGAVSIFDTAALTIGGKAASLAADTDGLLTFSGLTLTGALQAQGDGGIVQTGALDVGGTSELGSSGADVTLTDVGNRLAGAVTLVDTGATSVYNSLPLTIGGTAASLTAVSAGLLTFSGLTLTGSLQAEGDDGIEQTGALDIGGTTELDSDGNAITLTNAANRFAGAVTLVDAGAVGIFDTAALTIGGKAGSLAADTDGLLTFSGLTLTGALQAQGDGGIVQTGALDIGGTAQLGSSGAAITLTDAANRFGGPVTLVSAGATSLFDSTPLAIGGTATSLAVESDGLLTFAGLTLTGALQARGDGIVQTGALDVGGTAELDSNGAAVTLTDAGNRLVGAVTLVDTGATSIFDTAALTIGGKAASLAADTDGLLTFSGLVLTGALQAQGDGGIVQTGTLDIGGATTLGSSGAAVTLTDGGNRFGGDVTLVDTGATSLFDTTALTIGGTAASLAVDTDGLLTFSGLTLTGALQAQGDGGIVQTGALDVGGTATLGSSGAAITLANAANRLVGAVTLVDAGATTLHDTVSLTLGGTAAALTATTAGSLIFSGLTVSGALNAQAATGIGQTGVLTVLGSSKLTTPGTPIALGLAGNSFGSADTDTTVINAGTGAVTLAGSATGNTTITSGALVFAGLTTHRIDRSSNSAGQLTVNASGPVSQTGALSIDGRTRITTANRSVTLAIPANRFGARIGDLTVINAGTGTLTLAGAFASSLTTTSGALMLGQTSTGSFFTINATGAVQQADNTTLTVQDGFTINAPGQTVILANAGNNFVSPVTIEAGDVTLSDTGTFIGGPIQAANFTLTGDGGFASFAYPIFIPGTATITGFNSIRTSGGVVGRAVGGVTAFEPGTITIGDVSFSGTFPFGSQTAAVISGATGLIAAFASLDVDDFVRRLGRGEATQTPAETALQYRLENEAYALNPFEPRYDLLGFDRGDPRAASFAKDTPYVLDGFWEGLLR